MLMFLLIRNEACDSGRMWGIRLLARKADVNVPFEKMGLSI